MGGRGGGKVHDGSCAVSLTTGYVPPFVLSKSCGAGEIYSPMTCGTLVRILKLLKLSHMET